MMNDEYCTLPRLYLGQRLTRFIISHSSFIIKKVNVNLLMLRSTYYSVIKVFLTKHCSFCIGKKEPKTLDKKPARPFGVGNIFPHLRYFCRASRLDVDRAEHV